MHKPIFTTAALLFSCCSFSQVTISGKVKNAPEDAEASIAFYQNTIEWDEITTAKVSLDKSGNFKLSFPWNKAKPAKLTISEQYTNLFLVPKDSLLVTVDYSHFAETIHYTGRGSADNNYLAADLLADFEKKANRYTAFNDANKYKLYVDSIENLNKEFIKANYSPDFTQEFRSYITATTKYRFINPRWMYQVGYDPKAKQFFYKQVPENYFDFLKNINLNDEEAFDNPSYTSALRRYLSQMHDSKIEIPDSLPEFERIKMRVKQNYDNRKSIFKNKVLDYQLTTYLNDQLGLIVADSKFADELIRDYRATCQTPEYISMIDSLYVKVNKLTAGKQAPDFTLTDMNGKSVSLSSFKGKVVFIDFWATWCVPCIAAMPQTQRMEEKFKSNNDVVFLNVNVSDDIARWKKFVTKENMQGENLFATKEQSDNLFKSYNFTGIPHYVLIDKQGKIIDINADNSEKTEIKIENASRMQ